MTSAQHAQETRRSATGSCTGSHAANAELLSGILAARPFTCDVAVCVPFPYLGEAAVALAGSDIHWGAQDCSSHDKGAYTGEVSAARCWRSSVAAT